MSPSSRPPALVLASGSPRRRELLGQLGLTFTVDPAGVDERPRAREPARAYVERLAREKALFVAAKDPDALVLAADTSVVVDGEILGKPEDAKHAEVTLERLQGRGHQVITGVAVAGRYAESMVVETRVVFRPTSRAEIAWYVKTGEPLDKAGGYAIQGIGGFLVERIDGSHSNVIGLPLPQTLALLSRAGLPLPWDTRR